MFSVPRLLFYFLLTEAVKGIIDETTSGYACSIPNEHALNPGFVGRWFCYDINDESSYQSAEYMQYGYLQSEAYHVQNGITDITVSTPMPPSLNGSTDEENQSESESEGSGYLNRRSTEIYKSAYGDYFFGSNTTYTNLTIELSGLYLAPQDGDYQFKFTSYDNSAVMFFGAYDTQLCPLCAQDPGPVLVLKREYLDDNYQTSIPFFLSCIDMQCSPDYPGTVKLMAEQYYPIIIVYTNAHLQGSLGLQVTMPDGTTTQDFSSSVFNYYEGNTEVCEDSNSELYSSEFLTKTMSSETEDTSRYTSTGTPSSSTETLGTRTDVRSKSTNVRSTSTDASSTSTDILGAGTNVLSTSADASSTSTKASSTSTNVLCTSTEASSISTDVSSTDTEASSTSTNVLSTSTEASSISTDASSTSTKALSISTDASSADTETTKTSYASTARLIANSANDLLSPTASPSSSKNSSFSNVLTRHPSILSIPLTHSVIPSLSALSSFDSYSIDHTSSKPSYSSHRTSSSSSTILVPDAYTITLANEFETYFEIVSFVLTTGSDGLASIGTLTYDLEISSSSSFGLSTQNSKSNTELITSKYQTKTDSLSVTNTLDDTVFATSAFNMQYPHETISTSSVRDTVVISSTLYSNTSGIPTSVSEKTAMTNLISSGFRPVPTFTSVSDLSTSFSASKATGFVFSSSTAFVHSALQPSVSNTYVFEHNSSSSRSHLFSKGSGHLETSTLSKILSTARIAAESKLSRSPIEISLSSEALRSSEVFIPSPKSNLAASTRAFKEPIADSTTLLSNTSTSSEKPEGINGGKTLLPSTTTYIEIMSTSDKIHESQLTKSKSLYSSAQGLQKTVLADDLSSYNGENSLATYTISKVLNTNDTKYVSCPDNTGLKSVPPTPISNLNPTFSTKNQSDDITSNFFEQVTVNNSVPIICSKCFSTGSSSISNKITSAYYMATGHTPNTSRVSTAIITVISCDDYSCNKFEAQKSVKTKPARTLSNEFQPHVVSSTLLSTSVLKSAVHSSFSQNSVNSNQSSISSNIAVSTVGPESCVESICSNFYDSTILESSNVLALDTTSHMTTSFRSTNTSNAVTHTVSTNTFTTSTASLLDNIAPSNLPSFTTCYIFVLWVYWNL